MLETKLTDIKTGQEPLCYTKSWFCSDLETQLGSQFSPGPPGNEADGTKVQIFPVQRKHVNKYSCLNL